MQGVVEEMFMINRVELTILDHIHGISKFKDSDASGLQKPQNAGDKIINFVDMSDHVVRDHQIGLLAFARQLFGTSQAEEIVYRWHPNRVCLSHRPVSRIDTEAGNPPIHEIAEEISVIAGNLHHETEWTKPKLGN